MRSEPILAYLAGLPDEGAALETDVNLPPSDVEVDSDYGGPLTDIEYESLGPPGRDPRHVSAKNSKGNNKSKFNFNPFQAIDEIISKTSSSTPIVCN